MKRPDKANPQRNKGDQSLLSAERAQDKWKGTANGHGVSFSCNENVLKLNSGDGCTTL